jgi:type II secretory pathway pseudopilin PulG
MKKLLKKNKKGNNRRFSKAPFYTSGAGFTLVELLLYFGIFSILLLITLQLFSSIFEIQLESEATSSVGSDAKYLLQRFTYDVNNASSITSPVTYGSSEDNMSVLVNGEVLTYRLDSGNLILENETLGSIDQLNSSETTISALSFSKYDGSGQDTVQISFTLTSNTTKPGTGKEVRNFVTTAGIR